jgi:hypothetical protein
MDKELWSTCIKVKTNEDKWIASCDWYSGNFAQSGFMKGNIETNYYQESLSKAVDCVTDAMKTLNVKQIQEIKPESNMNFALYFDVFYNKIGGESIREIEQEAVNRGWDILIER